MEEKELAIRFIKGGEAELEEVIDTYSERLLRYVGSILCDHHEAEDVVQECFISAYRQRKNFDGEYLSSWLYKISYNLSLNKIKKRRLLYFANIFKEESYEMDFQEDELSQASLKALKKLKPMDRALVHARVMEEMSYEEISYQMGLSEEVLRKRYQRAKDKLAKELERKGESYDEKR